MAVVEVEPGAWECTEHGRLYGTVKGEQTPVCGVCITQPAPARVLDVAPVEGEIVEGREVVINRCYGGFGLSKEQVERLHELGCSEASEHDEIARDDMRLVQVVKEGLPGYAFAQLKIVTIPEDVEWHIEEYDGLEWVAENHRTWS